MYRLRQQSYTWVNGLKDLNLVILNTKKSGISFPLFAQGFSREMRVSWVFFIAVVFIVFFDGRSWMPEGGGGASAAAVC